MKGESLHNMAPAGLVEYGLEQFYLSLAKYGNLPWGEEPCFYWVHNPDTGWPSFIFSIRFTSDPQVKDIAELKLSAEKGIFPDSLVVSDHRSSDLLNLLAHAGFVPVLSWKGMWCTEEMVNFLPVNEKVRLEETCNTVQAEEFAGVVNEVLFAAKRISPGLVVTSESAGLWFYRVVFEDRLAGSIALHRIGNLCGVYLVTVKPEFRRMGIAQTATAWVIKKALDEGCNRFVLHASKMGEPVYLKLGFQPVSRLWILKWGR
jgi:GNAT superfamily N-acetyltransferase